MPEASMSPMLATFTPKLPPVLGRELNAAPCCPLASSLNQVGINRGAGEMLVLALVERLGLALPLGLGLTVGLALVLGLGLGLLVGLVLGLCAGEGLGLGLAKPLEDALPKLIAGNEASMLVSSSKTPPISFPCPSTWDIAPAATTSLDPPEKFPTAMDEPILVPCPRWRCEGSGLSSSQQSHVVAFA